MKIVGKMLEDAHNAILAKDWVKAETLARQVVLQHPTNPTGICILAFVHERQGDEVEAVRLFRQAIYCDSTFVPAYRALSRCYYAQGRLQDRSQLYKEWLKIAPDDPELLHMTAALSGADASTRCSDAYVRSHFDAFASTFDEVLTGSLRYMSPSLVAAWVDKHRAGVANLTILDAGCGTGLCGPPLRQFSARLIGVDLSPKMLEFAARRSCYDELHVSELGEFMSARPKSFDVIVSTDVFVYIGDLASTLRACHHALTAQGLLVFTVEALDDYSASVFRIQTSGRYAHSENYLRNVIEIAGFDLLNFESQFLRWELLQKVAGYCVVAQRKGVDACADETGPP